MASAWGLSWGAAWGNSWGAIVPPIEDVSGGGTVPKKRGWANEQAALIASLEARQSAQNILSESTDVEANQVAQALKEYITDGELADFEALAIQTAELQAQLIARNEYETDLANAAKVIADFVEDESISIELILADLDQRQAAVALLI